MEITNISIDELRKMTDKDGLVLQGCGGGLRGGYADGKRNIAEWKQI